MAKTTIEWTDSVWNPVRGCGIVSKECINCYAMRFAHRFSGEGQPYEGLTKLTRGGPVWTDKVVTVPEALQEPFHWVDPKRVFVNSMSDLFYGDENDARRCRQQGIPFNPLPFEFIADVFAVMACTSRHTYQILTKRPSRALAFFRWLTRGEFGWPKQVDPLKVWPQWTPQRGRRGGYDNCGPGWPLCNVWLGVSAGTQEAANERIPLLLQTPAAMRWVSAEPLLGPLSLRLFLTRKQLHPEQVPPLDWVVVGGESGNGSRPMHPDWARGLRDQCQAAGVPFFFKQWGQWLPEYNAGELAATTATRAPDARKFHRMRDGVPMMAIGKKAAGRLLDGRTWDEYPA